MGGGGGGTQSATIMIWGYGRGTALIWGVREYHKVENRCLSGLKSQCRCQIHNRPFLTCCIGESIWSTYPNYQKNAFNDFLRKSNGSLFFEILISTNFRHFWMAVSDVDDQRDFGFHFEDHQSSLLSSPKWNKKEFFLREKRKRKLV